MKTLQIFSGKVKELLQQETGVPINSQQLCGWVHKNDRDIDDKVREARSFQVDVEYCLLLQLVVEMTSVKLGHWLIT